MAPLRGRGLAFLRTLEIQAVWTYDRMQGVGLGYALEPILRKVFAGDAGRFRDAMGRATAFFNANPYLSPAAVGALARAEADGVPADQVIRLRTALGGPLGAIGDRLFWAGLVPVVVSGAVLGVALGAGIWPVLLALLTYNVVRVGIGIWLLDLGWANGMRVGAAIGASRLPHAGAVAALAAAVLAGVALPPAVARLLGEAGARDVAVVVGLALAMMAARRWLGTRATAPALSLLASALVLLWHWGTS
jgi:mannose/fructose/N-acetylgalactosamine-specific phosphotransferase system component IID